MRLDTAEKNQAAWDALPPLEGATRLGELLSLLGRLWPRVLTGPR